MRTSNIYLAVRLFVGILTLVIVLYILLGNIEKIIESINRITILGIIVLIILNLLYLPGRAKRWQIFKPNEKYKTLLLATNISLAIGYFTPGKAGEVIRDEILIGKRDNIEKKTSYIYERVCDVTVLCFYSILFLILAFFSNELFLPPEFLTDFSLVIYSGIILALIVFIVTFLANRYFKKNLNLKPGDFNPNDTKSIILCLTWTFIIQIPFLLQLFVLSLVFDIPYFIFASLSLVSQLFGVFSGLPAGLGAQEYSWTYLLTGLLELEAFIALTIVFTVRIIETIVILLSGSLSSFIMKISTVKEVANNITDFSEKNVSQ
ncbi:hypothetical protein CEE45_02760 [Candidatus Heimdallarchaeota archaeon B3_Heim]|nr:MAG: hypothetical protein CEE45_02760 [Candidatus Heimdallarchaeota archaeon B3_Heim]